jgi:hypothetical protein
MEFMEDWRRAIIRVWHGKPNEKGIYLGTAFFISPGYLLTCRHILKHAFDVHTSQVEYFPYEEIYLQSDTGAWPEGGLRKIQQFVVHPNCDAAYLPLVKSVPDAHCIPFASAQESDLHQGDSVQLIGYTTPLDGIESLSVEISSYSGEYDLEVTPTPVGKGMSGCPVLHNGKLVLC